MAVFDGGNAEADWKAALLFLHRGPSASLQFVKDDHRAQLHAYQVSGALTLELGFSSPCEVTVTKSSLPLCGTAAN